MTTGDEVAPVWAVAANIVTERHYGPGGNELRRGEKHFKAGAKVYVIDWCAGRRVIVVGRHRKSNRFIRIVIRVTSIERLRVKLVYEPTALKKIREHHGDHLHNLSKEFAETMCTDIPHWQSDLRGNDKHNAESKNEALPGLWTRLVNLFRIEKP